MEFLRKIPVDDSEQNHKIAREDFNSKSIILHGTCSVNRRNCETIPVDHQEIKMYLSIEQKDGTERR